MLAFWPTFMLSRDLRACFKPRIVAVRYDQDKSNHTLRTCTRAQEICNLITCNRFASISTVHIVMFLVAIQHSN